MDVNILKSKNKNKEGTNNTNKNSKENTAKYLLPQENSPYLTKINNRVNYNSKQKPITKLSNKSSSVPDKSNQNYHNKSSVNESSK